MANLSEDRALEIALAHIGRQEPCGEVRVGLVSGERLEAERREVIAFCRENGIEGEAEIDNVLREQGLDKPHWVVIMFPPPEPPGTASTAHAMIVRVSDADGRAVVER